MVNCRWRKKRFRLDRGHRACCLHYITNGKEICHGRLAILLFRSLQVQALCQPRRLGNEPGRPGPCPMRLKSLRSTRASSLAIPPLDRYALVALAFVVVAFLLDVRAPVGYSLWGLYLPAIWCAARWGGGPALLGIGFIVIV